MNRESSYVAEFLDQVAHRRHLTQELVNDTMRWIEEWVATLAPMDIAILVCRARMVPLNEVAEQYGLEVEVIEERAKELTAQWTSRTSR